MSIKSANEAGNIGQKQACLSSNSTCEKVRSVSRSVVVEVEQMRAALIVYVWLEESITKFPVEGGTYVT